MNINEIAKMAGVSRATVSRYFNDGYVSDEKRKAIQKVVEDTGYEPSVQAQNLRKQVTKLIGIIIPKLQSEAVSHMVDGIGIILSKVGYRVILANTQNNEKEELKYLQAFKKNQVDGIILMGTIFSKAHLRLMKEVEVPVVVIGQQIDGFSCVYQDDFHAAKEIAEILIEKGEKFGYIGVTTKDKAAGAQRKKGFYEALRGKGIHEDSVFMTEAKFSIESGYEQAKELIISHPEIDSLFCATDNIAIGAIKYLNETGKKIPEQVQLTGFGDTAVGQVVTPSLTTVHYFYETSGEEAARLLLEIIMSGDDFKKSIKMGYQVKEKSSTKR